MPELSKKVYPDGTEVTFKDTVAREQIATASDMIVVNAVSGQSSNSKIRYIKFGKMVVMSGQVAGGSSYMQSGTKVFEGLPKPVSFTEVFAVQSGGNGYKRFAINVDGEMYCYNALTVTNDINFYVCYVCQ